MRTLGTVDTCYKESIHLARIDSWYEDYSPTHCVHFLSRVIRLTFLVTMAVARRQSSSSPVCSDHANQHQPGLLPAATTRRRLCSESNKCLILKIYWHENFNEGICTKICTISNNKCLIHLIYWHEKLTWKKYIWHEPPLTIIIATYDWLLTVKLIWLVVSVRVQASPRGPARGDPGLNDNQSNWFCPQHQPRQRQTGEFLCPWRLLANVWTSSKKVF